MGAGNFALKRHGMAVLVSLALGGCQATAPDEASSVFVGGKADGGGLVEGSPEALAILRLANEAAIEALDDEVGLDRRAAEAIVEHRAVAGDDGVPGCQSLAELDTLPFVGPSSLAQLLEFVIAEDLLGSSLRIATFNVKWFGLDGSLQGSFGSETRSESLRAFIEEHLLQHDVIVFQEVVDVALFVDEVMFDRTCLTYDSAGGKHQHVVLCHSDAFVLLPSPGDDNFAIEELKLGNLRPGLHGVLATDTGVPVAYVAGVHLKAGAHQTQTRLEQAQILADQLAAVRAASALPLLLLGDFNTFDAELTGLPADDAALMSAILAEHVVLVESPVDSTFRPLSNAKYLLDRAWMTSDVVVAATSVPGPCGLELAEHRDAIESYREMVSDHCPVLFELELP